MYDDFINVQFVYSLYFNDPFLINGVKLAVSQLVVLYNSRKPILILLFLIFVYLFLLVHVLTL